LPDWSVHQVRKTSSFHTFPTGLIDQSFRQSAAFGRQCRPCQKPHMTIALKDGWLKVIVIASRR